MDESLTVSGSNLWIFFSDTCHTLSGWCELSYHIDRKRSSIFQFRNLLINWKLADGWRRRLFDWNIKHNRTNLKFVCHALGANWCKQDEAIQKFSISMSFYTLCECYPATSTALRARHQAVNKSPQASELKTDMANQCNDWKRQKFCTQTVIDNISVARWTTNFSRQPRDLIIHYAHRFHTLWSSCVWPSPSPQFSRIKIETTKIKIATFTHQHILTINDKEAEPKIKVEKFHSCRLGRDNKKFRRPSPPHSSPLSPKISAKICWPAVYHILSVGEYFLFEKRYSLLE